MTFGSTLVVQKRKNSSMTVEGAAGDSLRVDNTTVGADVEVVHVEDCCSNAGGSRSGFKRNFLSSSPLFPVPWYLITNMTTAE